MKDLDLPPFPYVDSQEPRLCETVRFYLAIIDDLSFEQVCVLSEHTQKCAACAAEFGLLQQTTHLLNRLPASVPSGRVDAAVLMALHSSRPAVRASIQSHTSTRHQISRSSVKGLPGGLWRARNLALVAALLFLLVTGIFLHNLTLATGKAPAFQLPTHLTWGSYVLHYTQTRIDQQHKPYQIEVYQDLGTNSMHIESSMEGVFDVVVVTDHQKMLGKDMMHHVAEEDKNVENWAVDGSLFDLALLRQRLASGYAVYQNKGIFQGQDVYQIRVGNGLVLLLNMQYLPVNVLSTANLSHSGEPLYSTCVLVPSEQVSDSMWDMSVPPGFQMGQIPAKS